MKLEIPKSTYSIKSVKDTIYWFSNDFEILLEDSESHYIINCNNPNDEFSKLFLQSLNDFSLRDIIYEETKEIKNLVAGKAFYPDLITFTPIGEFDDPVNMDIKNEQTK